MKGQRPSSLPSSELHDDHGSNSSSNREKIRPTITILPQEIVDEILYRLPVKSLLRFKCVSKRWLSTISHPDFNLYYKREFNSICAITLYSEILKVYSIADYEDNASSIKAYSVGENKKFEKIKAYSFNVQPLILKQKYNIELSWQRIISNACNGLVLIRINTDRLVLFNPSTRWIGLKTLKLDCLVPSRRFSYDINTIGLCYDASIDVYKVVVTLISSIRTPVFVFCWKNKRWVKITHIPFDLRQGIIGPLVSGHIHWTIETTIAYFEETRNTFEALPSPLYHRKYPIIGSGVLDRCLCIARKRDSIIEDDVEVVAMKNYGVAESWTTLYVLSIFKVSRRFWHLSPLLLTKNGEEVLFMTNDKQIWAYNPTSKNSYWKFDIPIDTDSCATSLEQTLVSLDVGLE
ncbi:hypothetical protein LguiB_027556 [Lonicera macranthoides]